MQFHQIRTDRLILREINPKVMEFVFENYSNSGLMNFFNYDEKQLVAERENYKKGHSTFNKSFAYFQLIVKDSDTIIGWCGYHTWYQDHFRAEIGYGITDLRYRQKGLMHEAMAVIVDYGFYTLKLNRIEAFIADYNTASLKILEKFKFKHEGCLKQHYLSNGKLEDSHVYGLLKEDAPDPL